MKTSVDLQSNHALSQFGSSVTEVVALREAIWNMHGPISDDMLLNWKRGRGGERAVDTYAKAEKWLRVAREVVKVECAA